MEHHRRRAHDRRRRSGRERRTAAGRHWASPGRGQSSRANGCPRSKASTRALCAISGVFTPRQASRRTRSCPAGPGGYGIGRRMSEPHAKAPPPTSTGMPPERDRKALRLAASGLRLTQPGGPERKMRWDSDVRRFRSCGRLRRAARSTPSAGAAMRAASPRANRNPRATPSRTSGLCGEDAAHIMTWPSPWSRAHRRRAARPRLFQLAWGTVKSRARGACSGDAAAARLLGPPGDPERDRSVHAPAVRTSISPPTCARSPGACSAFCNDRAARRCPRRLARHWFRASPVRAEEARRCPVSKGSFIGAQLFARRPTASAPPPFGSNP